MQAGSLPVEPPGKPKNTGAGSLSLLQQIFPTQGSNQGLLHCRWILYQLSHQGGVCVCVQAYISCVCVCVCIYIHIFLCPVKEQLLTWLQVLGLSWRAGQMQTCPVFRYSFQLPALCLLLFSLTLKGFLPFTARLGNLSFWSLSLTWTLASGVRLRNVVGHGAHD